MTFQARLWERTRARPRRIVFPEAQDGRIQAAAAILRAEGLADPILIGPGGIAPKQDDRLPRVAQWLRERRPDKVDDAVHALDLASDPLRFGASLVALGEADGCVAGAASATADVLRAALWAIGPADGVRTISSAFYMGMPDGTVLTFTDCAVVPTPSAEQLADIALAASRDRVHLVGDQPVVAFLSFSTHGSATGPSVDRMRRAADCFRALAPEIPCDGELQVDAALVPEVARRKAHDSAAAGHANILVFPDLDSGNIGYKLVQRLAGAAALGPLLQGLARPMSDLSRGASVEDIVEVAVLVAAQAQDR
ncbi:MAG: phosphate acyltransferase [Gemmatimonadales bacterium]